MSGTGSLVIHFFSRVSLPAFLGVFMSQSALSAAVLLAAVLVSGCSTNVDGTAPALGGDRALALLNDADGDSFSFGADCNDNNASIHPGAAEVMDGVDQECDGFADTYTVCAIGGSYSTINAAVAAAPDGLTLRICDGVYYERVNVTGKSLHFESINGAAAAIVDGGLLGSTFSFTDSDDSTITDLTVRRGSATTGGGVNCSRSGVTLQGAVVLSSNAVNGAGIYANFCTMNVFDSTVSGNVATFQGGGIAADDTDLLVDGSLISSNRAAEGGGLHGHDSEGNFVVRNSTILANVSTTWGGGLWADEEPVIEDNLFDDNTASWEGGGAYLHITGGNLSRNVFQNNWGGNDGGGLYYNRGTGLINNNTFLNNTSADDGGAARLREAFSTFQDNWIEGNYAYDDGGGVKSCHTDNVHLRNTYVGNTAVDQGGGLEVDNEYSHVVENVFIGNTATQGGGLSMHTNLGVQQVTDCEFYDNVASDRGAGLNTKNNPFSIEVTGGIFSGNTAKNGGAIYAYSHIVLKNSLVLDNTGTSAGGGVYARQYGGLIENVVFDGNSSGSGAALRFNSWAGTGRNNSITNNLTGKAVGASGTLPAAWAYNNAYGNAGNYNSTMGDRTGQSGNISVNPLYVGADDFHLGAGSPLINAGDPTLLDPNGTVSDIGAYGGPEGSGW